MGMGLSGGFAAREGAEGLEDLLKRLFVEGQAKIRNQQEERRIAQDAERLKMDATDREERRTDLANTREQTAVKGILTMTPPRTTVDPALAARGRAAGFGSSFEHEQADLPSRDIIGSATAGAKAPISGMLRMGPVMAGRPERDTFTGTAEQLAGEQARTDRLASQAEAQAERERVRQETAAAREAQRVQGLTDKKEMIDYVNANRPAATPHARFNVVQGTDADGKPALIRTNVDTGDISVLPVPTGTNFSKREQPATADQTNLSVYGKRVEQAEPTLTALEPGITKMNPLAYEAQTRLDHPSLQSKEMQQYMQSARNFINAVLRRESGAVISPTEFSEARKQYLPMPGDAAETLKLKAANRRLVFEQFKKGAGPAWGGEPKPPAGGGGSGFKVVEIK